MLPPTPLVQVTAWWDLSGPNAVFWTVEDPVLGALDETPIAGDLATDITSYVLPGISITRGRNRQTDEITPGTAVIRLKNDLRTFDPFYTGSPFADNIIPGKKFQISLGGVVVYTGQSVDYDYESAHNRLSVAQVSCEDSLRMLARAETDAWTPTAGTAADQINEALDRVEVNFGANRNITGGVSTLGAVPQDAGTKVLAFAQLAARSDLGRVFADRNDVLTFKDRHSVIPGGSNIIYFGDHARQPEAITDGAGNPLLDAAGGNLLDGPPVENVDRIPFAAIQLAYGSDILFTRTVVSRVGGSTETVDDPAAAELYGQISTGSLYTDLLLDDDQQSSLMADFLGNILSDPELRVASITVRIAACLSGAQQAAVTSLDEGSLIHVRYTPDDTGDPIDRFCVVEGIRWDLNRGIDHVATLLLGDVMQFTVWTVEDPIYGALDLSPIAF